MLFCDAHFHAADCKLLPDNEKDKVYAAVSCAHSPEEWTVQTELTGGRKDFFSAFGIHPQQPSMENYRLLEQLLQAKRIVAIGETGFDFYTEAFKSNRSAQEESWNACLELAKVYGVPLVVHNRKALDCMFGYAKQLSKIPAVIFHSFAFTSREALSLLRHGMNAYFSFGKPLLNNNKKSIDCIRNLPMDRILLETDAPFQTLKGESATHPSEIERVYIAAMSFRNSNADEFCQTVAKTFCSAFNVVLSQN
ncbi:MAG: TatD family hydrolase [Treponema sp.]|nr:TatD family hydrolase [Treponema sp.]